MQTGIVQALLAALLFGASTPLAKALTGAASPLVLAGLLYLGSGLGLCGWRALRRAGAEAPLARADAPWLAGAVLAGGIAGPALLLWGSPACRPPVPRCCSISKACSPRSSPGWYSASRSMPGSHWAWG